LRAWRVFPLWGTGLGTHEYVYPLFDSAASPYLAAHADNDYAELLEEMGIAGAVCVLAFLAWAAFRIHQLVFRGRSPLSTASFGIGFALLAVAIHSATDFGQHVPANFCLSAVFCGLLLAITNMEAGATAKQTSPLPFQPTSWLSPRRIVALALGIGLVSFWGWALKDAYAAFLGERWWAASLEFQHQLRPDRPATDQEYADVLAATGEAVKREPTNVKYGYWLNELRWQSLSRTTDPDTGQVVLPPAALPFVARIVDELSHVRRFCPTYGPPCALEGELRLFVLKQSAGGDLIRLAVRLASYDPATSLVAGELAARTGHPDDAQPLLDRAVQMNPAFFREVAGVYLFDLHRPDLAKLLAGDDYDRLATLTSICADSKEFSNLVADLSAATEQSLRRRTAAADPEPSELVALASVDYRRGDFASAADLYRRALNQDYKQVSWRLQLARALKELARFDEALHEARICLRLHPGDQEAGAIVDDLAAHAKSP
jgi:tetratricopeptide (TPR) repeat protein